MDWPFLPNWRNSVKASYEYKTEIIVSRSGREQRRALRQAPRKTFEYLATITRTADLRTLDRLMAAHQHQAFALPGAVPFAGETGYVAAEISSRRPTNTTADLSVRFEVDPGSEAEPTPPAADVTFNGREVFLLRPNWGEAVNLSYQHESEVIDFGFGRIARFTPVPFGTRVRKAVFLGRNRTEAAAMVDFFCRCKGRRGEFYMPSWQPDLLPAETAAEMSETLRIAGLNIYDDYAGDTVHRCVFVRLADGRTCFNRVATIDAVGGDSIITFIEPWPFDIDPAGLLMCCWMPACRQASDTLTVEWLTDSVAQVSLAVQTLEDL